MKFQSVDIEGILNVQRVSTLPAWNIQTDVGRLLFVRDENSFYHGKADGWERVVSNGLNPVLVIENYTARDQDLCLIDTRNGPITITLPPNPKTGSQIAFVDCAGTFETNQVIVSSNGKRIQRLNKDLILDINDFSGYLVYDPLTTSWKVSIEGVAQLVGNTTLFVHKTTLIADNIDGTGCQQQFNVPWVYNPQLDNISVTVQGVQQYHFEKTNQSSITLAEPVPAGTEVQICSIPLEGSFSIEHFVSLDHLEKNYISAKDLWQWILKHAGAGSGLDADTIHGIPPDWFLQIKDLLREIKKIDGPGSGIDADFLDGYDTAQIGPLPNKIVVSGKNGFIDEKFLPFGRGGIELVKVFEIPKGASAIDLTNLDIDTGYLVKGWNICPTVDDVRLSLAVYNETDKTWKDGFAYWTCSYTTASSSGLRDFNYGSDMTIAKHVKSVEGGVNFELWIDGFHGMSNPTVPYKAKTVRTFASFLGTNTNNASMFQSIGTVPKHWDIYSALRLYFAPEGSSNVSLIESGGRICIYKWIDTPSALIIETPDYSQFQIHVVKGSLNIDQAAYNNNSTSAQFPEASVEKGGMSVSFYEQLQEVNRSRVYPSFIIRDTHCTVNSFTEYPEDRVLEVIEGTMDMNALVRSKDAVSKTWDDLTIFTRSFNLLELNNMLKYDRGTDTIPEFELIDGHYTVRSMGGTIDIPDDYVRFRVDMGTLSADDLAAQLLLKPKDDFIDVIIENRAYNIEKLKYLLSKNWSTDDIPEVKIIDNSYTVKTIDYAAPQPKIIIKRRSFNIGDVYNNNEASDLVVDDILVRPRQYTINAVDTLLSRNWSGDYSYFTLVDGTYTVESSNFAEVTDRFTLTVRNGTYTIEAVQYNNRTSAQSKPTVSIQPTAYTITALSRLLSRDWSRDDIDGTRLIDGTYTITSLSGESVQLVVKEGQISMSNISDVFTNAYSENFTLYGRSYSVNDLYNALLTDRNMLTPDFRLVDGTYKVKTVYGETELVVYNSQMTLVDIPNTSTNYINDEFEIKGKQYSTDELEKLLRIDRNATTSSFRLIDGTYTVKTVYGEVQITVEEGHISIKNIPYLLTNYSSDEYEVRGKTYSTDELKDLLTTNRNAVTSEFVLVDGTYKIQTLYGEAKLVITNGQISIENLSSINTNYINNEYEIKGKQYSANELEQFSSVNRNAITADFTLVDGTYTVRTVNGEKELVIQNGQLSIVDIPNVNTNYIDVEFEVKGKPYSANELSTLSQINRNTSTSTFTLVDGTYTVRTVNGDVAQLAVEDGQISIVNLGNIYNDYIGENYEIKGKQYSANELMELLGLDRNANMAEFTLVDGTYIVTTLDGQKAKLVVHNGQYTLEIIEQNSKSVETNFANAIVTPSAYTVASLTNLLAQDYSQNLPEVQVKDSSLNINDLGK